MKESCKWLYFYDICQMAPLNVWPNTALSCNYQSLCMSQATPIMFGCSGTQCTGMLTDRMIHVWRSKWHNILAPSRESNLGDRNQNYRDNKNNKYSHIIHTRDINPAPAVHDIVAYLSMLHLVAPCCTLLHLVAPCWITHRGPHRWPPVRLASHWDPRCGWPYPCLPCSRVGHPSCCYSHYQGETLHII